MQRLTFERSRGKNVGLALLGSGLVAASWFTIQRAEDSIDRAFGWFGVIFLGSASLWRRNAHLKVALPSCLMAPASGRRTKLASFHGPMSRAASSSPCGAHVCFTQVSRTRGVSCPRVAGRTKTGCPQRKDGLGALVVFVCRRQPWNRRGHAIHPGKRAERFDTGRLTLRRRTARSGWTLHRRLNRAA